MRRLAGPVLAELGLNPPPHAKVGALPLADRQLLEICRALPQDPRVLILDEPTSALPRDAAARLAAVGLDSLVTAMLGQPSRHAVPAAAAPRRPGGAAVGLTSVTVPGRLREVSLTAAGGEIVGLAGLQGSGHLAALDAVRGRVRPASGTVRLPGGGSPRSPRHAVTEGVAELVELCDRVVVLRHGRIVDVLDGDRLTEPELSLAVNAGFADPL